MSLVTLSTAYELRDKSRSTEKALPLADGLADAVQMLAAN
jgi:hypothetical protein